MFRIDYTDLDKAQVEAVLEKRRAPVCAAAPYSGLAGVSMKIVFDKTPVEGPTLEYEFQTGVKLTLKENGGAAVSCDYAAHTLKDITLLTHMIPGTKRGYTVIINRKTKVATAFEMWFIDYEGEKFDRREKYYVVSEVGGLKPFFNREVQRQYYFGYVEETGKTPPAERDAISLRLENTMILWKEDRGKKRLSTYTSTTFTTHVELDTPDGGDVLTFASDILRISDSLFICCFGEVGFSGRLSVEVLDLFGMRKIGMTMGIDENDVFEHTLYSGRGEYKGRFAAFYDFNDKGNQYADGIKGRIDFSVKGARSTYRPGIMTKLITEEELIAASKNVMIYDPERQAKNSMSRQTLEDTDYCVGKELAFRGDDGFAVSMRFKSIHELEYQVEYCANDINSAANPNSAQTLSRRETLSGADAPGGDTNRSSESHTGTGSETGVEWRAEQYRAMELDENLIILGFYRSGSYPPTCLTFALDFDNGCATCIESRIGSKYEWHDVVPIYHFGVVDMQGLTPLRIFRQGFTDELLGRAFTWNYSDSMSSIHIYNAPHSYSWTIINNGEPGSPANRAGGPVWSSPCEYIKLRDDVYIMDFVEQKWDGMTDMFFMNLRTMLDSGFEFGITHDGTTIFLEKVGAIAREAGRLNLTGIYPLRNYNTRS